SPVDGPAFIDIGHGKPVLLLRGGDSTPGIWGAVAPPLAEAMRVIVPTGPADDVAAVQGLLRDAGVDRFAILAHGSGGAVAQQLAAEDDVETLVLIGSPTSETPRD